MRKGDTSLVKKVNYALGVLQKDGTLRRINKKWLGINSNYLGQPVRLLSRIGSGKQGLM